MSSKQRRLGRTLDLPPEPVYLRLDMYSNALVPLRTGRVLRRYYHRLHHHFGPQHWWPARTRFEVVLGALLTQNTNWRNVEKALANLRRAGVLTPVKLTDLSVSRLARLLRPSGYFRQKTRTVRRFLAHLHRHYRGSLARLLRRPTSELRLELLALPGIGNETADSILLYAAGRPVFVIDAYTRRILSRHWLAPEKASYAELQDLFHRHLRHDRTFFNQYHALLVAAGKKYCHREQPHCSACPLGIELESSHGTL
ncbi:MAG: endonuclease III domain-containing protein [Terriglobia bacterium]